MTISNMHDAVQIIGRAVGLPDLAPNAAGAFELVFFGQVPVYFQVIGEEALEIQLRLGERGQPLSPEVLDAMLAANLSLQHGRLAVEPGSDRVVYCGRVPAVGGPAGGLMPRVTNVIREGAAWKMERFASLLQDVGGKLDTSGVLSETLLRV
jgi:hypothetical protein